MKTNFKNSQKSLKIYKRKGDTTQMKNKILKGKSTEERKIFLNALHKTIDEDLKGSEEK